MVHTLGVTGQRHYDAVIIGAGVIGSAIAYELSRRGHRTLSVDKGPAAGYGPTSASCAIVRFSYSTYQGVAMSCEGLRYWENWGAYLESDPDDPVDETGLITYTPCGTVLIKQAGGGHHQKVLPLLAQLGIPHQDWTTEELIQHMPVFSAGEFGPPKRPDDDNFWAEPTHQIAGGVYTPESGYVSDPARSAHNLMRAAEAKGAEFRFRTEVIAINDQVVDGRRRTTGVTLADGTVVDAPVVVNVAGPHSYIVNQMAGVAGHCMAELIEAVQRGHDHDHYPLKVTGRFTGLELDLGAYSRNREINMNSSFSVNG